MIVKKKSRIFYYIYCVIIKSCRSGKKVANKKERKWSKTFVNIKSHKQHLTYAVIDLIALLFGNNIGNLLSKVNTTKQRKREKKQKKGQHNIVQNYVHYYYNDDLNKLSLLRTNMANKKIIVIYSGFNINHG